MSFDVPSFTTVAVAGIAAATATATATATVTKPPSAQNLGPLESVFTPAPACSTFFSNTVGGDGTCPECVYLQQGRQCAGGSIDAADTSKCWPAQETFVTAGSSAGYDLFGFGYYSPGIYCPSGYYAACSATGTTTGNFDFQFPPSASETAIGCCPTGYSCYGPFSAFGSAVSEVQTCITFTESTAFTTAACKPGTSGPVVGTLSPSFYAPPAVTRNGTLSLPAATPQIIALMAPMVQLIRQDSDLGKTASSTAGVGAAASGSSSGTQSTESSAPLSSKHRLSKGAIAGITVGTLIGTLAVLGAIVYLFRARRQLAQSGTVTVSLTTTPALEQTADWSTGLQVASSGKRDTYFSEKTQEPAMKVAQGEATGGGSSVGLGDGPYEMPAVQPAPLHELPG